MNDNYKGDTQLVQLMGKKVIAEMSDDGSEIVNFLFTGEEWDNDKAMKWIKNRDMNDIMFRRHEDGSIATNRFRLSASNVALVEFETDRARSILGESYDRIIAIERSHDSERPMLVETVAMNFQGKDTIVGNGMRFHKDKVSPMIDKFGGLPIYPGHTGLLDSHKVAIGNTVGAHISQSGDPANFMYVYPHGEGAVYRENLRIADVQGLLKNYPVSMTGKTRKARILDEDEGLEVFKKSGDRVYLDVVEWEPHSMDIIVEPALEGSGAVAIVNSKRDDDGITLRRDSRMKSVTEILEAFDGITSIALSDLLSKDVVRKAIESHVEEQIKLAKDNLLTDEKFCNSVIEAAPEEKLVENERIKVLLKAGITKHNEAIEQLKDSIPEVAKKANIELSKVHEFYVRNQINEPMTEAELTELIKKAQDIEDLSDVPGVFLKENHSHSDEDMKGVAREKVTYEDVKVVI